MGRRWTGRGLVVGACLLAFLGTGCTPDDPPPAPPSTTAPSPTPTENAQEREERLAYEAAEKSYREFRAEYYRVLGSGGAKSSTPAMKCRRQLGRTSRRRRRWFRPIEDWTEGPRAR